MYDPSEDPTDIEKAFRGFYAFLRLQIYSDYNLNIQSVEIVSQSVSQSTSISLFNDMAFKRIICC